MDYCWHCPICDVTMAIDASPEQIEELKARVASGDSHTVHEVEGGEPHLLHLIQVRH